MAGKKTTEIDETRINEIVRYGGDVAVDIINDEQGFHHRIRQGRVIGEWADYSTPATLILGREGKRILQALLHYTESYAPFVGLYAISGLALDKRIDVHDNIVLLQNRNRKGSTKS